MDSHEVERIKQKLRNLECPFCPKPWRTKNLTGLICHIRAKHKIDKCPVCGYSGGDLDKHLAKCNDEAHQIFYAIYVKAGNHQKAAKLRKIRKRLFGGAGCG